ncbi:MAG: methyltransferase domain-containing protein [Candidatus Alcyoniella australis]|nr:methyltransferase domain-containing protein [Candidatus Alcyoniella australis]
MTQKVPIVPPSRICPLCRVETPRRERLRKGNYRLLECGECGLVFTDHQPTVDQLEQLYGRDYFQGGGLNGYFDFNLCLRQDRINFVRRLIKIERFVPGGKLLDVGCGTGLIFEVAGPQWEICGVDISCYAVELARSRGHQQVFCNDFFTLDLPKLSFDSVICWGFLEHLPQPALLLERVHQLLKPGGVINIVAGDVGSAFARLCGQFWHIYTLPEVLEFFSVTTLSKMLSQSGFSVEHVSHETNFYTLDYLVERLARSLGTPIWRRRRPDKMIKLLNRIVLPVNFGDSMSVIARKAQE